MLQNLPMAQTFDVYSAWMDSMAQRGNLQDAILSLLEVLGNCDGRHSSNQGDHEKNEIPPSWSS